MKRIVLDTNVLVSAVLTPFGTAARVLDLVIGGEAVLLLDDRLLAEYREVLLRPKFGFDSALVEHLVDYFETAGEHVMAGPVTAKLPDPDDAPFFEVAVAGGADALVTGNKRHYPRGKVRVLSPSEFLQTLLTADNGFRR